MPKRGVRVGDPSVPRASSRAGRARLSRDAGKKQRGGAVSPYEDLSARLSGRKITAVSVAEAINRMRSNPQRSYCGVKLDLFTVWMKYDKGAPKVPASALSLVGILDSPPAFHKFTRETYEIVEGKGIFYHRPRGTNRWFKKEFKPGNVIDIPPGTEHKVVSKDRTNGTLVKLTFNPPLAHRTYKGTESIYRDEYMVEKKETKKTIKSVGGKKLRKKVVQKSGY
ncbi:MAG: hypothetical protein J4224_01520 [Candidatus Diapherotrites archaeon]|uniref:Cupin domain-containing protein n=1 Tax=Candidatus Iainarchaeum sp. TaxID=3101447 RepID=A0A7J4IX37_9ARCH|nr:MAG: hypothetical protein QT03_C0001G0430 [archaeon GW2011_AR10]MBS3059084.1 hypothetical protein [Candidatus Diapherotrites archaeon]HIH08839.1 hypothetical protein [Candidatus Diapherotrites archaeon]